MIYIGSGIIKTKLNLTDNGRTVIKKDGSEESISARGNWKLWKYSMTLEPSEIESIITNVKNKMKYEKDVLIIRGFRRDILILSDAQRIKQRMIDNEKDELKSKGEIKRLGLIILGQLGFNRNTLYKNELDIITDEFTKNKVCLDYEEEIISTVVISEILKYYDVKYNILDLINIHNIEEKDFYNLSIKLNRLLNNIYWKPKIIIR